MHRPQRHLPSFNGPDRLSCLRVPMSRKVIKLHTTSNSDKRDRRSPPWRLSSQGDSNKRSDRLKYPFGFVKQTRRCSLKRSGPLPHVLSSQSITFHELRFRFSVLWSGSEIYSRGCRLGEVVVSGPIEVAEIMQQSGAALSWNSRFEGRRTGGSGKGIL